MHRNVRRLAFWVALACLAALACSGCAAKPTLTQASARQLLAGENWWGHNWFRVAYVENGKRVDTHPSLVYGANDADLVFRPDGHCSLGEGGMAMDWRFVPPNKVEVSVPDAPALVFDDLNFTLVVHGDELWRRNVPAVTGTESISWWIYGLGADR